MRDIIKIALIAVFLVGAVLIAQETEETEPVEDAPEATEEVAEEPADATSTPASDFSSSEATIGSINEAYEAGADAVKSGDTDAAISYFQQAVGLCDDFLSGIVNPSEEAQAKYFRGLAKYYWGKLAEDSDVLAQSSEAFIEAATAFTNIEKLGRFYLDSKYRRGLASFRQYQYAKSENVQVRKLSEAYGDFRDFLEDPALEETKSEMTHEIEQAKYLSAFTLFMRGVIKLYDVSEQRSAKNDLTSAAEYFAELNDAQDAHISVMSRLMEGESHYYLARLYMQVRPDEWEDKALSNQSRDDVILSELNTALSRIQSAKSSLGAWAEAKPYVDFSLYNTKIAQGAAGEGAALIEAQGAISDMSVSGQWATERDIMAANTILLQYFAGRVDLSNAAIRNWQPLAGQSMMANYWIGWVKYIEAIEQANNYPQASTQFTSVLSKAGGSTREAIIRADAKFREAECTFWDATLKELAPMLQDAKASYQALTSSSGAYYKYLPQEIINQAQVRVQIIEVQEGLTTGTSDINRVITRLRMTELELPEDAKAYLNFGRYFLEKANREAGQARLRDVGLAHGLFKHVADNGAVASNTRNEAKFLSGIALIKEATALESRDEALNTMNEAKSVLGGVNVPLKIEASYSVGIGYFNIEEKDKAQGALNTLKDKYIRPAYVYGMANANCVTRGTYLKKVIASTPRSDTWHLKSQAVFDRLDCSGNVPPQSGGLSEIGSPITYESLADAKAQMDELRSEAMLMWQKVSEGKTFYPIDNLVSDSPPKTTISVEFIVQGTDGKPITGEHTLVIDDDPSLAEKISSNRYRATLSRATHDIEVDLKGYYKFSESLSITEEQDVPLSLKKAVRYVKSSSLGDSQEPMAIATAEGQIVVANNEKRAIIRREPGGGLIGSIPYEDVGVAAVTGLAIDGDYLLIVDGRRGQIKMTTSDGGDVQPIAVEGESYGGSRLIRPAGAIAREGKYYIVDSGNNRVVVFEGVNYRSKFGDDILEHPMDIAYRSSDNNLLVTDLVLGKVFVFTLTGDFVEEIELPQQRSPSAIYLDQDGFIYVADYVSGRIVKYTNIFGSIGTVSREVESPIAMGQVGHGPDATVYVAGKDAVQILKGAWDNAYSPK